jgi:hypothetical protein
MGVRFSWFQRQQLKQLILECDVQRFTVEESLAYIKGRMRGETISEDYLYLLKKGIQRSVGTRLKHLREHRTAFIEQIFRRIDEIEKYQKELWAEYHKHPNNVYLRLNLIRELHQLTITLDGLYKEIPQYTGVTGTGNAADSTSEYEQEYRRSQAVF